MGAMEKVAPELLLHLAHQMQLQTYIYNIYQNYSYIYLLIQHVIFNYFNVLSEFI